MDQTDLILHVLFAFIKMLLFLNNNILDLYSETLSFLALIIACHTSLYLDKLGYTLLRFI